jgi:hypothetical protein
VIIGDERMSARERLDVYANMYFYRILDVLRDDYPKLLGAVGDTGFHNLATDYLLACPPTHPSIAWAGARLPGFLVGREPAWLADLARLEWARREVFDGPDAAPLSLERLRALSPDAFATLPLRLIPCSRRLSLEFAVDDTWRDGAAPAAGPRALVVWRREIEVLHRAVEPLEWAALARVADCAPFGAVCDLVCERPAPGLEDAAQAAFALLGQWVADGLLAAPES